MMKLKGSWGEINGARWCSGLRARHSCEFCKSTMLTKQTYKLFNQRDNAIWLDGIHFPPPSPSLALSGLPLPGFLWCGGQNGETTGTICQMCVSHTKLPLCHIWVSSPREIAWNLYVLCSIEISLRNTQTNQVSSSLSVHKHRLLKYFYRRLSVQLKHSYRAVTWSDSGIVQINTGQTEALMRLPVNRWAETQLIKAIDDEHLSASKWTKRGECMLS